MTDAPRGAAPRADAREPLKPAYLIVGDDLPKIEEALKRLKRRIVEESGCDLNIDEFDAAGRLGAAGGQRRQHPGLPGRHPAGAGAPRPGLAEGRQGGRRRLSGLARRPMPVWPWWRRSSPPADLLRAAMEKHGEVLEYLAPKEGELPAWLVQRGGAAWASRLGLQQARLLVQRCGDNQSILLREAGEARALRRRAGRITDDDIRLLTTATVEASIFDLLDSLALGRGAAAFSAADELLASGERTEVLFYRILRHFQNLSRVAALRDEGYEPGGHPGRAEDEAVSRRASWWSRRRCWARRG